MTKGLHEKFCQSREQSHDISEFKEAREELKDESKKKEDLSNSFNFTPKEIQEIVPNYLGKSSFSGKHETTIDTKSKNEKFSSIKTQDNEDKILKKLFKSKDVKESDNIINRFRKIVFAKKVSEEYTIHQLTHIYKGLVFSRSQLLPKKNLFSEKQMITLEESKSK